MDSESDNAAMAILAQQLRLETDSVLDALLREGVEVDTPTDWAAVRCTGIERVIDEGAARLWVWIEGASPDDAAFARAVAARLRLRGWHAFEVKLKKRSYIGG